LNLGMSLAEKARIYHDFGTLLKSGFHMDRAVELLLGQNPSTGRRHWLMALRQGLSEKLSMSQALASHGGGTVTELELGLIEAGERGGRLEDSCSHLAEYFELRKKSLSKAAGALVYPLILAHLGALVPDLSKAMEGHGVGAAFAAAPWRILGLWAILGSVAVLALGWLKLAATSEAADRILGSLPMIGGARRHWALARFAQVMRTCLLAALNISESLRLAGGASQSAVLKAAAQRAADSVVQGTTLSVALTLAGGFPGTFVNGVEMAENAGTLDVEIARWMKAEMEMAATAQDRLAEWLPRVVYVIVVLWIAARIVFAFSGYFEQLQNAASGFGV
jgi:type II secretory pathway component PulF